MEADPRMESVTTSNAGLSNKVSHTPQQTSVSSVSNNFESLEYEDIEQVETNKKLGNEAYIAKDYWSAEAYYTKGICALGPLDDIESASPLAHILFGNRSNTLFQLSKYSQSLKDAEQSIRLCQTYAKGYHRAAMACKLLGEETLALDWYKRGLSVLKKDKQHESDMKWLLRQYQKLKPTTTRKQKATKTVRLYPEMDCPDNDGQNQQSQTNHRARALRIIEKIRQTTSNHTLMNGVFEKLQDPIQFRKTMYKQEKLPDNLNVPRTFQELMNDKAFEEDLLNEIIPMAEVKAKKIFENVKRKGALEGDFMDPTTEEMLKPRVLNEAIARGLIEFINRRFEQQQQLFIQNQLLQVADPNVPEASWNQLGVNAIQGLSDDTKGYGIQDNFLDDQVSKDWLPVLLDDAERAFASSTDQTVSEGKSEPSSNGVWLTVPGCEEEYPALYEVASRLEALVFELNKKMENLKLSKNVSRSVLLRAVPIEGSEESVANSLQQVSMDGNEKNLIKVSCMYCFTPDEVLDEQTSTGVVRIFPVTSPTPSSHASTPVILPATKQDIEPVHDRLIVLRSRVVPYQQTPGNISHGLGGGEPKLRYTLSMFFTGPIDDNPQAKW